MRVRASFAGRVQGVGFRATTHAIATGHQVSGWVRNEPDGTVTVEAQGTPDEIDRFLTDISQRLARYIATSQRIEISETPDTTTRFVIQR